MLDLIQEKKPCSNCGKLIYYRISKLDNKGYRHMIISCSNCLQEVREAVEEFIRLRFKILGG